VQEKRLMLMPDMAVELRAHGQVLTRRWQDRKAGGNFLKRK
jgi:hypothetical protein